jgi:hypothetical protein
MLFVLLFYFIAVILILYVMASSTIGNTTLICSWLFTALAMVSIAIQALHIRERKGADASDFFIFAAFFVSIFLVVQTTWAVLDEGQGVHQSNLETQQFAVVAKVSSHSSPVILISVTLLPFFMSIKTYIMHL